MRRSHFLAALLLTVTFPGAAFAYLDPATGSMLLQLLLGGVAGLAVAVKLFWHRILSVFGARRAVDDEPGA